MNQSNAFPNEEIAAEVVTAMTHEKVLSSIRMTTGDQYFVFAVKTTNNEYVIRMANADFKKKFEAAIYWQEKLIPLGVPLAKFIKVDLDGKYSPFLALLMQRLPGNDLCNVYLTLSDSDKRNLANEIVKIHAMVTALPIGKGYGIANSYEQTPEERSWYEFIANRLQLFKDIIKHNAIFDAEQISKIILIAKGLEENLRAVPATPFLWDASERNVIVHQGKISGIVDVDDLCFGDPLFVLGITYAALEMEGYDTLYPDYWAEAWQLDKMAQIRLDFYRLFFVVVFMRKHSTMSTNQQKIIYNENRLQKMFDQALTRMGNDYY